MDGLHFITESLLKLWYTIDNDHQPSKRHKALKALYKTQQEAKDYEDIMKSEVFDYVFTNYTNLKKVYQQAAQQVQNINKITSVQEAQANRFLSPIISFGIFRDFLANRETRKGKAQQPAEEGGGVQLKLLPYFMQERMRLRAIKFLPILVNFYKLLTTTFSHRLTEQQAMEMNVPQCIDIIRNLDKPPKTNLADTLTKQWKEFVEAWSQIRELLAELEGCPDQQRNRQFESYISKVDEATLLVSLISHPNALDQHDEILRVANELVKKQNSLLHKRDYYGKWNEHRVIFEDKCANLNLAHLPLDSDKQDMLVTGNYNQQEFEKFILSHVSLDENFTRNQLGFDVRRIKRQVLEQFLCGKFLFETSSFRQTFTFKASEDTPQVQKESPNKPRVDQLKEGGEGNELLGQHLGIRPLRRVMKEIANGPYSKPLAENRMKPVPMKNEKDFLSAADQLRKIISQIISRDPAHGAKGVVGKYSETLIKAAASDWLNTSSGFATP
jgi:hypothetical protein